MMYILRISFAFAVVYSSAALLNHKNNIFHSGRNYSSSNLRPYGNDIILKSLKYQQKTNDKRNTRTILFCQNHPPKTVAEPSMVETFGLPRRLWPVFISYLFDSIAAGLVTPLLPFYVMELKGNAMHLSSLISINSLVQMIACIFMGKISDKLGRRVALLYGLTSSSLSYFLVSCVNSLPTLVLAKTICGSSGGLLPIVQSIVADVSTENNRAKYLGRIPATLGLGFLLGQGLSLGMPTLPPRLKIRLVSLFPFIGLILSSLLFKESRIYPSSPTPTSAPVIPNNKSTNNRLNKNSLHNNKEPTNIDISLTTNIQSNYPIYLLVLNGFFLMMALSSQSVYPILGKEAFGFDANSFSKILAANALIIGIVQVFFIKHILSFFGTNRTLAIGNLLATVGLLGVSLLRKKMIHLILYTIYAIGYCIADTSVVSLIMHYASTASQGRYLALNQAGQSFARVISPFIAGFLYELGRKMSFIPAGSLPFIVAASYTGIGILIPSILGYFK